jgi:aspartate racemase
MKTIGLIGGMSWESTLLYYKLLNLGVKERLGGLHSAKIILNSVDFAPIAQMQNEGRWEDASRVLTQAALSLEKAGADVILLCTNTMHKIVPTMLPSLKTPFLHIAKATSKALKAHHAKKVLLLGTKFTMQEPFYQEILREHGIETLIPDEAERQAINRIIFEELCVGKIETPSHDYFVTLIEKYQTAHPDLDAVILGCTEIGLLIKQESTNLPIFDTTIVHVNEALKWALSQ